MINKPVLSSIRAILYMRQGFLIFFFLFLLLITLPFTLAKSPSTFATSSGSWVLSDPGSGGWNRAIVIDPTDKNVMYLSSDRSGIYKSTDGGESWNPAWVGLLNFQVDDLDISKDGKTLIAATSG